MPKIALDTVRSLINYLSDVGLDRENLLQHINIAEGELNQSQQLISIERYEKLYGYVDQFTDIQNIGFEFGQAIEADRWGILGYIAFTSPDLISAIESQRRYQSLVGNLGVPAFETEGKNIRLKWLPSYQCSRHTVEEIITGWISLARKLSIQKISPRRVYFHHVPKKNQQTDFQNYFGCEVIFNSDFNGVEIASSLLETKLRRYDPVLNKGLCDQADGLLEKWVESSPVKMITEFIIKSLPTGVPEIELAASNLHLSVRTLQRKLREHQLTFSQLVDSVRQDLAISYLLETDTKMVQIAQMLGFSEQSAFQRAFKRWKGISPMQFRQSNK